MAQPVAARSEESATQRHILVRREQHDRAFSVRETEGQDFRHELADLTRREVHDRGDQSPDQGVQPVVLGDLGAGSLDPDGGAEVDGQLVGRLAGLGERLGCRYAADADVDREELLERVGSAAGASGSWRTCMVEP
jgi:hypothetical protein